MKVLRSKLRLANGNPDLQLSGNQMDIHPNRRFVQELAQNLFQKKIHMEIGRGGKASTWVMYRGRTLVKYLSIFDNLHPGESPLDALVSLDHLKGNGTPRIALRLRELMTQAWEEVGFDLKGRSIANVRHHLEMLVNEENKLRCRNGLPALTVPSSSILKAHGDELMTPMEMLIATKGERYARDKCGRGSSDVRALFIGESVEIGECKASLVVSARARGIWERLSSEHRATLEEIDEEIRSRLQTLVMIDVASRMPLAWVISDQARADATLNLLRMATRDKSKES